MGQNQRLGARQLELLKLLENPKVFIQAYKCYEPLRNTEYDLCDEFGNIYQAINHRMITSLLNKNQIFVSDYYSSWEEDITYYKHINHKR